MKLGDKDSYWTATLESVTGGLTLEVVKAAQDKRRAVGSVRILYTDKDIAFVNSDVRGRTWVSCPGCAAVEWDCPDHGHIKGVHLEGR